MLDGGPCDYLCSLLTRKSKRGFSRRPRCNRSVFIKESENKFGVLCFVFFYCGSHLNVITLKEHLEQICVSVAGRRKHNLMKRCLKKKLRWQMEMSCVRVWDSGITLSGTNRSSGSSKCHLVIVRLYWREQIHNSGTATSKANRHNEA